MKWLKEIQPFINFIIDTEGLPTVNITISKGKGDLFFTTVTCCLKKKQLSVDLQIDKGGEINFNSIAFLHNVV